MIKIFKISKRAISFVIFILVIISCSCNTIDKNAVPSKNVLRLGVNNWLFWRSYENGKFKGTDVDIWCDIAKRCNLFLEYKAIPDLDYLKMAMENDSIDVFVSMLRNEQREKYMVYVEPPYRTKLKFITYTKQGSNVSINTFNDMHEKKIALVGGGYNLINDDSNIEKKNYYGTLMKDLINF